MAAEYLINPTEIGYVLTGAYGRLMELFEKYRKNYGANTRKDLDRENEMLGLYALLMSAQHNNSDSTVTQTQEYQKLINKLYSQFSIEPYTSPIINGV